MKVRMKLRRNTCLAGILILSVLLRLTVAVFLGEEVDAPSLLTDQRSYHALGARLVSGYGFSFDRGWYPFTPADTPTAHWSFLYSLFVGCVYALFGVHPLAARLVQAVLGGLLLPWLVYKLAKLVFSPSLQGKLVGGEGSTFLPRKGDQRESIALLAALMTALYGYFILYAATLMTETFYITAALWSLERSLKLADRLRTQPRMQPLWPLVLSLGMSLGIATLLRQSILPWVPVLFLYLCWVGWRAGRLRAAVLATGIACLILVAFILPWTVRNYRVYGDFLLLNSNAGYAMYSAQHPMHGTAFREFEAAPVPEEWWGRPEPELDRRLLRQGIQYILDDPGRYLALSLSRARALFEFWPTPDTTLLHNMGRTGSFGLFLPLMIYGLVLAIRHRPFVGRNVLLFLFMAFYTVLHVLTWAMVRYRLPVDAVLIPFAALAALNLAQRVRVAVLQWAS
jgi:hypothetical protein